MKVKIELPYPIEIEEENSKIREILYKSLQEEIDIPKKVLEIIDEELNKLNIDEEIKKILKTRYILLYIKLYHLTRKSVINSMNLLQGIIRKEISKLKKDNEFKEFFEFI